MLPRIFIVLWLVLFLGCSNSSSPIFLKKIVKINLGSEPHTLDPRLARDPNAQTVLKMLFEGLTRMSPGDIPQLALAEKFEILQEGKVYRFTLRSSLWSNGMPVRATDFAQTWKKILSPNFTSDNAYQLYVIKNGKGVKAGLLPSDQLGILVIDDQILEVELEHPVPYFLELLASPFFFAVCTEIDEDNPAWMNDPSQYVCNGPFVLHTWKHENEILVTKNSKYWDATQVHLEGIFLTMLESELEMKLFEKGELHWVGSPLSQIPVDAIHSLKDQLQIQPRAETSFLRLNVENKFLFHPKIRKALAFGIHRAELVNHVLRGSQLPALQFIPPSMQMQEGGYFPDGNISLAKALFEEGISEIQLKQENFPSLRFLYIRNERNHILAQALQQQLLNALGIQLVLEGMERKVFFDRLSQKDYELALSSWGADFHDPVNFLEVFKYKSQSTNNTNWEDTTYVEKLEESSSCLEPSKRMELLGKCEKILMEAMPIIPLYHLSMQYCKNDQLQGVYLSSLGSLDFKWANLQDPI